MITDQQATLHSVAEVSADEAILAMIEPIETELESWLDQPLGKVNGDMRITDPMQARIVEHPYVEFINRVQMAASGRKYLGQRSSIMKEKASVQRSRCGMSSRIIFILIHWLS